MGDGSDKITFKDCEFINCNAVNAEDVCMDERARMKLVDHGRRLATRMAIDDVLKAAEGEQSFEIKRFAHRVLSRLRARVTDTEDDKIC